VIFITRIPTHYNDGTPIPVEVLNEITAEVYARFGGFTLEGPGEGGWVAADGTVYSEQSRRLEVACERNRYSEARDLVLWIGQRLFQKAMYFEVRYFDGVEILTVPPVAESESTRTPKRRKPRRK
jgi:hypothetical protein